MLGGAPTDQLMHIKVCAPPGSPNARMNKPLLVLTTALFLGGCAAPPSGPAMSLRGIMRDMVMEVAVEGKPARDAASRAQGRLEALLKSKGYLK